MQYQDVERAPTVAGALVVIVAVALLARVPVQPSDIRPTPTPTAPATATDGPPGDPPPTAPTPGPPVAEDLAVDGPAVDGAADPSIPLTGADWVSSDRLLQVRPLDPRTLQPLTREPLALTAGPVRAVAAGGSTLFVGTEPLPRAQTVQALRADPPTEPAAWSDQLVPDVADRTWLGASAASIAWGTPTGRLTVIRPVEMPWTSTRLLAADHVVVDGGYVGDDVLAVLTAGPGSAPNLLVQDTRTGELLRNEPVPVVEGAPGSWLHAVDGDTGLLHLVDLDAATAWSVDVRTGTRWRAELPGPPPPGRTAVAAGHGRLVVHELERPVGVRATGPDGFGTVLYGPGLDVLAARPDLRLAEVLPARGDRLLARPEAGGFGVLDERLAFVALPMVHGPSVDLLGTRDGVGYAFARSGDAPRAWLYAIDLATGLLEGSEITDAHAAFAPEGALLVTRPL